MRVLVWVLRTLVFLFLCGFAILNTDTVSLRFFFGATWQAPLVVILFLFFLGGVLLALIAVSSGFIRLRREVGRLRKATASTAVVPAREP